MRSIAFLTQKGGAGKSTLVASVAAAAATAGERVIALDLDPQGALVRWSERREAANSPNKIIVEPLENERLPRLRSILDGLSDVGFTLAIFDTASGNIAAARLVIEAADLCLLPSRPTRMDVETTGATFRAVFLAKRKAAFVLNQCPPAYHSTRASDAAKALGKLGVLAEPMLSARMDFQDAMAAGLGVTEYASGGRAAQEITTLWNWIRNQFANNKSKSPAVNRLNRRAA